MNSCSKLPINLVELEVELEEAISDLVRGVATELRMFDLSDYIDYLMRNDYRTLEALIDSAVSMYVKPGVLTFAHSGEIVSQWGRPSSVRLDMKFRSEGISALFALHLNTTVATVELRSIDYGATGSRDADPCRILRSAISSAKLELV